MMRYLLFFSLVLSSPATELLAQYSGGTGDGFSRRSSLQLDLTGVPVGTRPLYAGGTGDGFDRQSSSGVLSGQPFGLYQGGRGDGFDRQLAAATLGGQDVALLYGGGAGDGFDRTLTSVTLTGISLSRLYRGGPGDGFDGGGGNAALNGQVLTGLYTGGPGDGFDRNTFAGVLAGEMLLLYGGGRGDGFDVNSGQASLNGQSLTGLYGGGPGDGFDLAYYFGVVPLPLTLVRFDAFPEQDYVLIRWQTEDEIDTDFFTVEKTRDGRDFAFVGETEAAGYSEPGERISYALKDPAPYRGTSFYRLQTTEFDGSISLSHLVEVQYSDTSADWDFVLFPNPNTGRQIGVRPSGVAAGAVIHLDIFDATGRHLLAQKLTAYGGDHQLELAQKLAAGSYLIRMTDDKGAVKAKLLLVGK